MLILQRLHGLSDERCSTKSRINALIKAGAVPIQRGQDTEQANKLAHKDTDARWTKKAGKTTTATRTASTSTKTPSSLPATPVRMPAYMTARCLRRYCAIRTRVASRFGLIAPTAQKSRNKSLKDSEHTSQINERAYRGKPLSESQEISNKANPAYGQGLSMSLDTWEIAWVASLCAALVSLAPRLA